MQLAAVSSLGVAFTAAIKDGDRKWPFVTLNDFQERCASTMSLSKALFLELLPVVSEANRVEWETYSVNNQAWISEGLNFQDRFGLGNVRGLFGFGEAEYTTSGNSVFDDQSANISDKIYTTDESGKGRVIDQGPGPYYPRWQASPVLLDHQGLVNYNLGHESHGSSIKLAATTGQIVIAGFDIAHPGNVSDPNLNTSFYSELLSFAAGQPMNYTSDPISSAYVPVVDSFDEDRTTVALLRAVLHWGTYFNDTLPEKSEPVIVVVGNSCEGQFSFEVSGDGAEYLGEGNYGNPKYSDMAIEVGLDDNSFEADPTTVNLTLSQRTCRFYVTVYPSEEMDETYNTIYPLLITYVMASVFISAFGVFLIYDRMVEQRQKVVMNTAQRSTAIVSSIFPKQVVGRLMSAPIQGNATKLRSLIHHTDGMEQNTENAGTDVGMAPIADLFPEATVMFADVQGFTAWSSIREPSQVFALLENLYNAFDQAASRRRVFKVETVGDCYVSSSNCDLIFHFEVIQFVCVSYFLCYEIDIYRGCRCCNGTAGRSVWATRPDATSRSRHG